MHEYEEVSGFLMVFNNPINFTLKKGKFTLRSSLCQLVLRFTINLFLYVRLREKTSATHEIEGGPTFSSVVKTLTGYLLW